MAERAAVRSRRAPNQERVAWSGLLTGDTGAWVELAHMTDKTVQISGAAGGAAGAITIEGTNEDDPVAAETVISVLDDIISNTPLSGLTPFDMGLVGENPVFIRPIVTGGDGTTNLTVVINATGRRPI